MNQIRPLFRLFQDFSPKVASPDQDFWRGADLALTSRPIHPEFTGSDELIVHPLAHEAIAALKPAIGAIAEDSAVGYDYQSKFKIIKELLLGLPMRNPGLEVLKRALFITLKAHERTLYFAYGSNMDLDQMADRCPGAIFLGLTSLPDRQFVINSRGVASIRRAFGAQCEGAVFALSKSCIRSLDRYEGIAHGLYRKESASDSNELELMTYVATDSEPFYGLDSEYLERIRVAAEDLGISREHQRWIASFARGR